MKSHLYHPCPKTTMLVNISFWSAISKHNLCSNTWVIEMVLTTKWRMPRKAPAGDILFYLPRTYVLAEVQIMRLRVVCNHSPQEMATACWGLLETSWKARTRSVTSTMIVYHTEHTGQRAQGEILMDPISILHKCLGKMSGCAAHQISEKSWKPLK